MKGMSGLFDLGPLGCEIQKNIIREWRKHFVLKEHMQGIFILGFLFPVKFVSIFLNFYVNFKIEYKEIDCPILTAEQVLQASGHLSRFSDFMVRDSITNESFRADHLLEAKLNKKVEINSSAELDEIILKNNICSPTTGNKLTQTTEFNLMFQTQFGPSGQQKW